LNLRVPLINTLLNIGVSAISITIVHGHIISTSSPARGKRPRGQLATSDHFLSIVSLEQSYPGLGQLVLQATGLTSTAVAFSLPLMNKSKI
jgi:hypothetical protein